MSYDCCLKATLLSQLWTANWQLKVYKPSQLEKVKSIITFIGGPQVGKTSLLNSVLTRKLEVVRSEKINTVDCCLKFLKHEQTLLVEL